MSCEGQSNANMWVDSEASINWGASLGEGSVQGNVAAQSQSRPDLTDLLSRGRSASCSPTARGQTNSPNTMFHRGEAQHCAKKRLGHILQW